MISETKDPNTLFKAWLAEAEEHEINNYNAVNLATVGNNGRPSNRMMLLKGYDKRGFVIYTNYESRKGQEILSNDYASLCFYWKSTNRQVRIEGKIVAVAAQEADEYFATRDRGSQIGAWASKQSSHLENRSVFEERIKHFEDKYSKTDNIPRPPHWSGFRVIPDRVEFWQEMPYRQHDRVVYTKTDTGADGNWTTERVYP
ncbi:MAG: pyridoxamine 5'-phosphate oxidase [Alphaproteobacteria bacterium]|nr:pyridoxamine 5'-phosphate oxidase [Alphaproteobacteria bacterium]